LRLKDVTLRAQGAARVGLSTRYSDARLDGFEISGFRSAIVFGRKLEAQRGRIVRAMTGFTRHEPSEPGDALLFDRVEFVDVDRLIDP
jgi:hypothetical protein